MQAKLGNKWTSEMDNVWEGKGSIFGTKLGLKNHSLTNNIKYWFEMYKLHSL